MKSPSTHSGIALLLALWIIMLISAIATALLRQVGQMSQNMEQMEKRVFSKIHTENCLNLLAIKIQSGTIQFNKKSNTVELNSFTGPCIINIVYESERLDLNYGNENSLLKLFFELGITSLTERDVISDRKLYLSTSDAAQALGVSYESTKALLSKATVFTHEINPTRQRGIASPLKNGRIAGQLLRLEIDGTDNSLTDFVVRFTGKASEPVQITYIARYLQ
jgi:hypothetical protein